MRGLRNLTLPEVCRGLADPGTNRVGPSKDRVTKFDLAELLFSAVTAVLCGAQSYVQMEIMDESKLVGMRRHLPFDNGIPSATTFRNVLSRMNQQRTSIFCGTSHTTRFGKRRNSRGASATNSFCA